MKYNINEHGDLLEKEATKLIRSHFQNYELVWSIYIGNKGNESIATLPNYPDDDKRKNFAENSYTVLESAYLIYHILESNILEEAITTFQKYIEFNKAFILIFTLLGRIHDTALKASYALNYDNTNFQESIHKFFEARSVVVHGKKVPLIPDNLGILQIPFLKTSFIDGTAWDDKHSLWNDVGNMNTEYAVDKLTDFFYDLLALVNKEYIIFYHLIQQELNSLKTELTIEYVPSISSNGTEFSEASGITSATAVDVYGFKKLGL